MISTALVASLLLASPATQASPAKSEGASLVHQQLKEANEQFTYAGAPINPLAVKELLGWLSDGDPGPVAIALAGTHKTDRYFGEYEKSKDGRVTIDLRTTEINPPADANMGYFEYLHVGRLPNGLHVLDTWDNGGGSGVFEALLLVRFEVNYYYGDDGARHDRVTMIEMGQIPLGDRRQGKIEVQGDAVRILTKGEKPRTLHFD
jgi:hypothetical protein